ncbi:MAG: caspase family protein, partial [Magnetococcales bacterium]|nr:caspase family protein [Magnetococcales bacterium]
GDPVILGGDVVLSAGSGAVTFGGAVDGAHNLTVNTSGLTRFSGIVGGTTALTGLTTNAGGTTQLDANVSTSNGAVTFGDPVILGGDVVLSAGSGAVTFGGAVDGAHNLTVNTSGLTRFSGIVGGTTALTGLTTNAGGTTQLDANVSTSNGAITFGDPVILGGDVVLSAGSGAVTFGGAVDGAHNLTVNTSGLTRFSGIVGGSTALTGLTTNVGGTTQLDANVSTSNGAVTFGDPVTFTVNAGNGLTIRTNGGDISFVSISGNHAPGEITPYSLSLLAGLENNPKSGGTITGDVDVFNLHLSGFQGELTGRIESVFWDPMGRDAAQSITIDGSPSTRFIFNGYRAFGLGIASQLPSYMDPVKMVRIVPQTPAPKIIDASKNPTLYNAMIDYKKNELQTLAPIIGASKNPTLYNAMIDYKKEELETGRDPEIMLSGAVNNIDLSKGVANSDNRKENTVNVIAAAHLKENNGVLKPDHQSLERFFVDTIKFSQEFIGKSENNNIKFVYENCDEENVSALDAVLDAMPGKKEKINDVSKKEIISSIRESVKNTDGTIVIFFSGHGILFNDEGYWAAGDVSIEKNNKMHGLIGIKDLREAVSSVRDRQILIVSDSCYPGKLESKNKMEGNPDHEKGDKSKPSLTALVSTSGYSASYSDSGVNGEINSPFVHYFNRMLMDYQNMSGRPQTGQVGVSRFYRYLKDMMSRYIKFSNDDFQIQTPQYSDLDGGDGDRDTDKFVDEKVFFLDINKKIDGVIQKQQLGDQK